MPNQMILDVITIWISNSIMISTPLYNLVHRWQSQKCATTKKFFREKCVFWFLIRCLFFCVFCFLFLWGVWCPAPCYHGQSRLIKLPISGFRIFYSKFTLERFEEFQNKISLLANKEQLSLRNSSILCWEIHVKHKFQCCKNTFGTVNSTTF